MQREQNLLAAQALNQAACLATSEEERLRIAHARYRHQIIEAILTENINSLPEAKGHG